MGSKVIAFTYLQRLHMSKARVHYYIGKVLVLSIAGAGTESLY